MKKTNLFSKIIFICIVSFTIMYFFYYKILVSNTNSLTNSVFLLTPKKDYKNGDIVTFNYQFENYFKYKKGDKFTKIISCSSGQKLKRVDLNFFCDDKFIGSAIKIDGKGQKLKSFEITEEIIPTKKYFLMGTNPKSYDSRYYGYIDEKDIIGVTYGLI